MAGSRFGVWRARGVSSGLVLLGSTLTHAQSTASFPDPIGASGPAKPQPAAVAPATTPVAPAPMPSVPSAPPTASVASPPTIDSTTDSRYPVLQMLASPSAVALPSVGLASAPAILPYRAGLPIPPGYRVEHRSANGLIASGLVTLIVSYGAALAVGLGDGFKNGTGWTVLPVIGPWAAIGARSFHCASDPLKANDCVDNAFSEVQTIAILSGDAVVQATGAVLFLAGLGSGEDQLVRSDLDAGLASVHVTPRALGSAGFGIAFDGRF